MAVSQVLQTNGKNVGDTNSNGLLDPGEIWIFKATGIVAAGLHTDTGTATGIDTVSLAHLTASNPANYTGEPVEIQIIKTVNGSDANDPTNPLLIPVGGPVVWTYTVKNLSGTSISNVKVIDDNGTPNDPTDDFVLTVPTSGDNGNGVLDKNETWVFTAPARTAVAGLYTNVATVQGTVGKTTYYDNDPASYFGWVAGLQIDKATNGVDADSAPGLILAVGSPVIWTYQVSNTGNIPLAISVRDDFGTSSNVSDDFSPKYVSGDTNGNGKIDPNEIWLFTSQGVVTYAVKQGQYVNDATVSATAPDGSSVTSIAASYHFGVTTPQLSIQKSVNAADPWHPTAYEDANYPNGVVLPIGSQVIWSYLVTNNGAVQIDLTSVTDDGGLGSGIAFLPGSVNTIDPNFNDGDLNHNSMLDPGETWLFEYTGTVPNQTTPYHNIATANGVARIAGVPTLVTATDGAYIQPTASPGIHVVKYVNGQDANTPADAVYVKAGAGVTWTYVVTSASANPLTVTLRDDNGTPGNPADDFSPTFTGGDTNGNHMLDQGETWRYTATGVVPAGLYGNVALATGTDGSTTVYDDDLAYAFGAAPAIQVVKAVNALDPFHPTSIERADSAWVELVVGTTATFTYIVTDTGNIAVSLNKLTGVVDDNGTPGNTADDFFATYVSGDTNNNGMLDLNEVWLFRATTTVVAGAYVNTGTATGFEPKTSQTVTSSDSAGYFGNVGIQGLTPGFWKNNAANKNAVAWPRDGAGNLIWDPGQAVSTMFSALITVGSPYANLSLADALGLGGGGIEALLRQAISAVLAATSPYVAYPLSAADVIAQVNAAILNGSATPITALANTLAGYNNAEANLDQSGNIPTPTVSISSTSVIEGNSGLTTATLTVTLSGPSKSPVTVKWSTVAGTATAGTDFVSASGTLIFVLGGTMTLTIPLSIIGDTIPESNETFSVVLSSPVNATLATATGTVTIADDDGGAMPTTVSVAATDPAGAEQLSDPIVFTVTRGGGVAGSTIVNLGWSGTATLGSDYTITASGATLGAGALTLTFAPGATTASVTVTPIDDNLVEGSEGVTLTLKTGTGYTVLAPGTASGTIADNDTAKLSVGNASVTEGDKNTTNVNISVTLSNPSTQTITVVATTVAGTAHAGTDFVSKTATLTFAPGTTTVTFTVAIVNDKVKEPTEQFTVVLSSPTGGAAIANGTGTVTIIDNDGALFAAAAAPASSVAVHPLTQTALAPIVAQAETMWRAAMPSADFSGVTFTIVDLAGDLLGYTLGRDITIDPTADGWGWSVMEPLDGTLRMALLTVVLHELGMALGFTEDDPAEPFVMARTLTAGVEVPPQLLPIITSHTSPARAHASIAPVRAMSFVGPGSRSGEGVGVQLRQLHSTRRQGVTRGKVRGGLRRGRGDRRCSGQGVRG